MRPLRLHFRGGAIYGALVDVRIESDDVINGARVDSRTGSNDVIHGVLVDSRT